MNKDRRQQIVRFFDTWVLKKLDYHCETELTKGSPADVTAQLIEDAADGEIAEDELSKALGGNIQGKVFETMMKLSDYKLEDPTNGPKH